MTKRRVYVYELRIQIPLVCFDLQIKMIYVYINEFAIWK